MTQELFQQATKLHQAGQLQEAEKLYRSIIRTGGAHPILLARLGTVLQQLQRPHEALEPLLVALKAVPDDEKLIRQCSDLCLQLGKQSLAESCLRQLMAVRPNDPGVLEQLIGCLLAQGKEDQSLELTKSLLKAQPQNANAYNLKGLALCRLGETDKGYKAFQKAVRLNPSQLGVVRNLILYGKGRKEPLLDQIIPQFEQQFHHANLDVRQRMNIAYVLFMHYEKVDPKKAFVFLKAGNDINRAGYQYAPKETEHLFGLIRAAFSSDRVKQLRDVVISDVSSDLPASSPIFILGMPRSGTTLVEQILSSHTRVEAEGELEDLRREFERHGNPVLDAASTEDIIKDSLIKVAKSYLESTARGQSVSHYTDKMPYNFMLLGLIMVAIPNAKVIHCTRDPVETCYSIYKQNFSGSHAYTNKLSELGHYYNCYREMMAYWNDLFPGQIYEANYERMVANSDAEIRSLIDFCGLEMQDACLAFYKNKRAVRTASVSQVRQPIYKDSVKVTAPLQEELKELIEVLEKG